MNKREKERFALMCDGLYTLGILDRHITELVRVSRQLSGWGERLCNDTEEDEDGRAYRLYNLEGPGPVRRYRVPNRGAGALRRLAKIAGQYEGLFFYHQPDPRGAALYVGTVESLNGQPVDSCYTQGVAVY